MRRLPLPDGNLSHEFDHSKSCGQATDDIEWLVNVFRAYISPIITIVGVFGNAVAMGIFVTHRPLNRFSIYVIALAISDSLVLLTNTFLDDFLGRGMLYLTNRQWMLKVDTLSVEACRLMELTQSWFAFTSGALLVAFGFDRLVCLYRPLRGRLYRGAGSAAVVSFVIVFLGLLFSLPPAIFYKLVSKPNSHPSAASEQANSTNESDRNVTQILFLKRCMLPHTTDGNQGHIERLSFVASTVFTYMVPCILLVVSNVLFSHKLISLSRRRTRLCKTVESKAQLAKWTATDSLETGQPEESRLSGQAEAINPTVQNLQQRSQAADQEARREARRLFVLVLLSGIYVCFTFPLTVVLAIRASLPTEALSCQMSMYAHITRLLTSVKDINYALNGYVYAFFFNFYYKRVIRMLSCCIREASTKRCN